MRLTVNLILRRLFGLTLHAIVLPWLPLIGLATLTVEYYIYAIENNGYHRLIRPIESFTYFLAFPGIWLLSIVEKLRYDSNNLERQIRIVDALHGRVYIKR